MDEYSDRVDGDDDAADNNNSVLSDTSTLDHDEDKEVSLLEYARYYDLCQDYTAFNPLDPIGLPSPSLSACLSSDDLSLPDLPPGFRTEERCTLDLGAATFLRSITSSQMDEDDSFYDYRRNDEFKVERPLLQTDAELDLKRFRGTRKADDEFDTTGFTNFETPEDDEQKLEWLDPKLPAMKDKEAQSEKLQLSKAAVDFLKDISSNAEMDLDDALLLTGESVERHKPQSGLVTPPLLPISPPFTPVDPPSPVDRLELATSPMDPSAAELDAFETLMMGQDAFSLGGSTIGLTGSSWINSDELCNIYPPLRSALKLDSSSPLKPTKRERPEDFKVEVPLTPQTPQPSPMKKLKTVAFSENLNTLIPECARPFSPDGLPTEDYDTFYGKVIHNMAEPAIRESNQEQLSEADSVMRVEVPVIDDSVPPLPWELFSRKPSGNLPPGQSEAEAQRQLLSKLKQTVLHGEHQWPGVPMIIKALDRWEPFPDRLGKVDVMEEVDDDGSGRGYLSLLKFAEPDVSSLLWKLEGLRILDDGEDDDYELEEADLTTAPARAVPFGTVSEISQLGLDDLCWLKRINASKPKLPLWNTDEGLAFMPINAQKQRDAPPHEIREPSTIHQTALGSNAFSADISLSRFMQVQTGLPSKFEPAKKGSTSQELIKKAAATSPLPPDQVGGLDEATQVPLPVPTLPQYMPPRCFILPTHILAERKSFVHEMERLYPEMVFVERDLAPQATAQGSEPAAYLGEADILVSPGTGLVFTTLQKIKQKTAPGHKNLPGIRERIMALSPRYEQLIVLISEGQSAAKGSAVTRTLDTSDCDALSFFIGCTAMLDTDVQVLYVPGGEIALARWTVSCMARHMVDTHTSSLQQDETLWELLLRQAGMNAFAAQAVLSILKASTRQLSHAQTIGSVPREFGLAAFLSMTVNERIRRFGALMGGDRVLRRVSSVVDAEWGSMARA